MFIEPTLNDPFFLCGKRVVLCSDCVPKMQLSPDVLVSDAFRAEINQWMLEFFGTVPLIPDGQIFMSGENIFMNNNTLTLLRMKLYYDSR